MLRFVGGQRPEALRFTANEIDDPGDWHTLNFAGWRLRRNRGGSVACLLRNTILALGRSRRRRPWRRGATLQRAQRDPVRPPESVLRPVLASARTAVEIDDVILLHHATRLFVRSAVEREPPRARRVRESGAAVPTYSFDCHPFERRPPVGRVPLLTGANARRSESPRLEKPTLEIAGDLRGLERRGQPEKQWRRARERGSIG